jgi:hypothetical protein
MDRRLIRGGLAVLAAAGLAGTGATLGAPQQAVRVPGNSVGLGVLQLDLADPSGARAALSFSALDPGDTATRLIWVSSDAASTMSGRLELRWSGLVDTPAPCSTGTDKAAGEIASGVAGCTITADRATGTPAQGNLSRVVAVDVRRDDTATTAADCGAGGLATDAGAGSPLVAASGAGNLPALEAAGPTGVDTVTPGHGVCLAVDVAWPGTRPDAADPDHPVDNAAMGDRMQVSLDFSLQQEHA